MELDDACVRFLKQPDLKVLILKSHFFLLSFDEFKFYISSLEPCLNMRSLLSKWICETLTDAGKAKRLNPVICSWENNCIICKLKVTVHPKMKVFPLIIHPRVVPNT